MAEWQDRVIASANVISNLVLVPSIVWGPTPTTLTSVPTALCLFAVAASLWSLDLRLSSATAWICCLMWTALAVQGSGVLMYFWRAGG